MREDRFFDLVLCLEEKTFGRLLVEYPVVSSSFFGFCWTLHVNLFVYLSPSHPRNLISPKELIQQMYVNTHMCVWFNHPSDWVKV